MAAAPLLVVLAGMVGLGRSAAVAGAAGLAVAAALTALAFGVPAAPGPGAAALGIGAEALHSTAVILWIILPALAIHEFGQRSGAVDRIRDALAHLTSERRMQAVLIAWFFGLFMEGAAGFGTPVALAAPLLVGLGFAPVRAVILALLGHAAGVSFGAVGTPTLTQAEIAGLPARDIALGIAALHAALGTGLLLAVVWLAGEGAPSPRDLRRTLAAAALFLVPSVGLAALVGPELPTLGGGLVGLGLFAWLLRRGEAGQGGGPDLRRLLPDLAPYLLVLVLVLLTRLVPPLRDGLSAPSWGWTLPGGFHGSFQPLFHPGTLLVLGLVGGAALTGRLGLLPAALGAALGRLGPVALALLVMLALSRLMVHSGMIAALAEAAARTGALWPLLAPLVGVLGTFVTGSATASNILFTEFQSETAAALGLAPVPLLAAQGFGAAIGNVVAPHNIIAGSATVGLHAREGEILRRTAPAGLAYALAGGLLLILWT
nr:L-lactate permease [Rubellimicrobium sp. CFH 75288]